MLLQCGENCIIEASGVWVNVRAQVEGRYARGHRAIEHHRIGVVADDDAWLGLEAAVAARIEDRLHVAPSMRGEKSQSQLHRSDIMQSSRAGAK